MQAGLLSNSKICFSIEPGVTVSIEPSVTQLSVLDYPPYNSFILTCLVEGLEHLAIQPSVFWTLDDHQLTVENGYFTNTTTPHVGAIQHVLTYTNHSSSAGTYRYFCKARLSLPGEASDDFMDSATVVVKGWPILLPSLIIFMHNCTHKGFILLASFF